MQTVASLAERLDMSAEEALKWLRYMLFDVEDVDAVITDAECDLLIDVDDDEAVAEKYRKEQLKKREKEEKRNERLRQAAKKAAAKRKAAAKKPAAKKKAAAKKKEGEEEEAEEGTEEEAEGSVEAKPIAEILPPAQAEDGTAVAGETEEEHAPVAEILPPKPREKAQEEAEAPKAEKKPKKEKKEKKEKEKPAFMIGEAAEVAEPVVLVLGPDGKPLEEIPTDEAIAEVAVEDEEDEETGLIAEAERQQEEEDLRRAREASRPLVKPDPAVVAEVKRRAAERMRKMQAAPRTTVRNVPTGKTARKRQKKAEKQRQEEVMRRKAAATVRELQSVGPTGQRRRKRRQYRDDDSGAVIETEQAPLLEVTDNMTVEQLAAAMEVPVNDLILDLMDHNVLATKNQTLGIDLIRQLAEAHGFEVETVIPEEAEVLAEEPDDPADVVTRAPVITVMGHVDHGKTSLLDHVRRANVAEGEAGGITQHIAAYEVNIGDGRVVFLDTPGHEAFTQMRARGAQVTDVVVLVVAADDGVMPQTVEAIDHAKAAEVPIVVAINKCDKAGAEPDRIRQELIKYELVDEQWGGKTIMKNISAKTGMGVDELMELLVLESDLLELKANPKKRARGAVIESEISRGQGPVAWVLVKTGTLRIGDVFLAGKAFGRVRTMLNSRGKSIDVAGPSTPVVVTGFSEPPDAGDQFVVLEDERVARSIAEQRSELAKQKEGQAQRRITLEDFQEQIRSGERKKLHVVIKADVQGSVDVLESSLGKLGNQEVSVELVHSGVGGVNESDVLLASASDAVIIGFHVSSNIRARKLAEQEGVDIRTYRVIYEAIDDIRSALEGMLKPETKEIITGHAEIREVFRSSSFGNIAGCYVLDGEITRTSLVRLVRDGVIVHDQGRIGSLRRVREDVRSVSSGYECGIKLESYEDIKAGDVIEAYRLESVAKTLA